MNIMHNMVTLNRHLGLGGTDAKRIVEGDWHALYLEKVGLREAEDLSDVFKVQLGSFTEGFHLDWVAKRQGWHIQRDMGRVFHADHDFMFAHLDGWVHELATFIETKHTRTGATLREKAHYYMPQLQHYLAVTDKDYCIFSIIAGNEEPEHCRVDRNGEYIERLIEMERSFWWHVTERVAPEITPTGKQADLKVVAAATMIDGMREYNMTGNNQWASEAATYLDNKEAAAKFDAAKSAIKLLVPNDGAVVTGHGVTIKRAKNGSLRFS